MKATVNWKQNLAFVGTADSGYSLQMDADPSLGGDASGIRPMELLTLGLAGCTAMDVISIVRKKRQVVNQFEVKVDAPRSKDHPHVFTRATITYIFAGHGIDESAVLRAIELAATKYCPAQIMFSQLMPIDLLYEIYEDEGNGEKRLVVQGAWQELPLE
jgi:putative redox protein